MGVGSLVAPWSFRKLLRPVTPGRGRVRTALLIGVAGAVAYHDAWRTCSARLDEGEFEPAGEASRRGKRRGGRRPYGAALRSGEPGRRPHFAAGR